MSDFYAFAQQASVGRSADGNRVGVRATRDGALVGIDWFQALALEGRVFIVDVGGGTTAIAGDAGWAATTPDVQLEVPTGTSIILARIEVSLDLIIDDIDMEIIAAYSDQLDTTPTGGTAHTPFNLRSDAPQATNCTVESDITAITDPATEGTRQEFWRINADFGSHPVAAQSEEGQPHSYSWNVGANGPGPILVGPASLHLWVAGSSALSYFAYITWAEFSSGMIT